ncbi:hypothetical protein NQ317_006351 [Molorchus minor]|uniref:Uncharacterized protein n=1 Tax=Molorchus minor TaxID=1323400 RepID=A0ABQ9JLS0_9CUCU|nr:hypothetical protein NQ317_006351 [Molorchus minor]
MSGVKFTIRLSAFPLNTDLLPAVLTNETPFYLKEELRKVRWGGWENKANPTLRHTGNFLLFQGNCPVEKFFKDDIEQRV